MPGNKNGVTNYDDPHDADNYSNPATNGGYAGTPGSGTDTEDFIIALNKVHFGGYSEWRMPTIKEITSIGNYNISGSIICSFSSNRNHSDKRNWSNVGSPQDVTVIQRLNPHLFLYHPMGELNLN